MSGARRRDGSGASRRARTLLAPAVVLLLAGCAGAEEVDPAELARQEVAAMPGLAAGAYQEPGLRELASLSEAARYASTGARAPTAAAADVGYVLDDVRQAGLVSRRAELVLLRPSAGARVKGWGWVALRPHAVTRVIVEVPHPRSDVDSELVAGSVFATSEAAALVVAGAHRRAAEAADVAVQEGSAFHAWQTALVEEGDVVLQVHGFDAAAHPDLRADAVVSDGRDGRDGSRPSDASRRVAEALERAGFDVCLHHRDRCDQLAGTRNVQGAAARAAGAQFVHLELSRPLRSAPDRRAKAVTAIATAVSTGRG